MSPRSFRMFPLIVAVLIWIDQDQSLAAPTRWVGEVAFRPGTGAGYCTNPSGVRVPDPSGAHVGHLRTGAVPGLFEQYTSTSRKTVLISTVQDLVQYNGLFSNPESDIDKDPCGNAVVNDIEYFVDDTGGQAPCWKVRTSDKNIDEGIEGGTTSFQEITTPPEFYVTIITRNKCPF